MPAVNTPLLKCMVTAVLALSALLTTGCATMSALETEVLSFSTAPASVKPGPFTFERLPSQYQEPNQTLAFEQMAQKALEQRGFTRKDAGAQYSVQIGAWSSDAVVVYPDPFFGRLAGPYFGRPRLGHGRMFYAPPWPDRELYLSRVRLEIRDLGTGKVVYESTATNEQSWFNAAKMFPAMFEAALADFPSPPSGPRKVIVKLPEGK